MIIWCNYKVRGECDTRLCTWAEQQEENLSRYLGMTGNCRTKKAAGEPPAIMVRYGPDMPVVPEELFEI
jgi:hypothetical protein